MAGDSGLEGTLTHGKIAGVPVWAAGVGMAALFIGVSWWRNRNTATPPAPDGSNVEDGSLVGQVSPDGAEWGLPPGPIGDWLAQHPEFGGYPTGFSPRGLPSPITNVQWSRLVSDELLGRGFEPAIVYNALTKYLAQQALNAQEQAIINRALELIGAPPEGLIPVVTNPPPTDTPPGENPPPDTTPPTDTNLPKVTGVNASSIWTFAAELHWRGVNGADSYKVTVSPDPQLGSEKTLGPITGKMILGVRAGQTYTFTVAARKGSKIGPASDPVSLRIPTAAEGGHTS